MANNIFEEFKSIFETNENINLSSAFMINRLLSFTKPGIQAAIECNKYTGKIPNSLQLKIYRSFIDKGKAPFVKYAKIPKENSPKLISAICKHFTCNKNHAKQIIKICSLNKIKIEEIFGLKKNE